MAFVRLSEKRESSGSVTKKERRIRYAWQALATLLFAAVLFGLLQMLRFQASSGEYTLIQRRQMIYRPVYALCFAGLVLSAPFSLPPLRKLL